MKLTNLKVKDLIRKKGKFTFLIGAGCSVDAPSCLPTGYDMMKSIIKYTCIESELENILKLDTLRFEALIEIIRDYMDPELKIIEYYDLCEKPNIHHFFLADMVQKGHFVMTTNFDFLIENALLQSYDSNENIIPVITRQDFIQYKDPQSLFKQGKKTIYKIHGSTKNIITGEDTKETLITTIQSLGLNKKDSNLFQVEPFKKPLLENITYERSLVVMGYSGSDDFDIIPTLKSLHNIHEIIWINHISDNTKSIKIYELDKEDLNSSQNLSKVDKILMEIKNNNKDLHVYKVDGNTTTIIRSLIESEPELSEEDFSIDTIQWFKNNLKIPGEISKFYIPHKIYIELDKYDDAIRCGEEIIIKAEELNEPFWVGVANNNIGNILEEQGKFREAISRYDEALQISSKMEDLTGLVTILSNIAGIYYVQDNLSEALEKYENLLKIINKLGDASREAMVLNNIAMIYRAQGNYPKASELFQEALDIAKRLGDLSGQTAAISNLGMIKRTQGEYQIALEYFNKAFKIAETLGDLSRKAIFLRNIGSIYRMFEDFEEALKTYEIALNINKELGNLSGLAISLNDIGTIYMEQGKFKDALDNFEEALRIDESTGNFSGMIIDLNNIGFIYLEQENYHKALEIFQYALVKAQKSGDRSSQVTYLNNIGGVYRKQKNYTEALRFFNKALKIAESLGELFEKANALNNIGNTYYELGENQKALKLFQEAYSIMKQLGLGESIQGKIILNNIKIIKKKLEIE